MRLLILLVLLLITVESTTAHSLHLSITNIDFVGDTAKISIRIIDNNLFLHFTQCYPETAIIKNADSTKFRQQFIIDYFNKMFRLEGNGTFFQFKYVDTKIEEGGVWFFFVAIIPSGMEKFTIENRILTECYKDQKNLILIKKGDFESGLEFDNQLTKTEVHLK